MPFLFLLMHPYLVEAVSRLDAWLDVVCQREAARAARLTARTGDDGWATLRAMLGPPLAELVFDDDGPPVLLPPLGDHPLAVLGRGARLDRVELEVLLVLLAPHLEPRYRALYAVLQDSAPQAGTTERLILAVLGRTPARREALYRTLFEGGRLIDSGFVTVAEGGGPLERALDLAPDVRSALLASSSLYGPQSRASRIAGSDVVWWPWPASTAAVFDSPLVVVWGTGDLPEALGRGAERSAASRKGLLMSAPLGEGGGAALGALWRAGVMHELVPVADLTHLDVDAGRDMGERVLRLLERYGGRMILLTRQSLPLAVPHHELRLPSYRARRAAWIGHAAARGFTLADASASRLASVWRWGEEEIARVFAAVHSVDEAALDDAAVRLASVPIRHAVAVPARRTFEDLVVRESTRSALTRLVFYAQSRDRLTDEGVLARPFDVRQGPVALFSGLSGTGKTLAAEAVAHALGRPLYLVDLSQLVSKYIGETEKHVDEVLREAERAGAVLFFDEADAMFGARSEQIQSSNDRWANLGVGFLLQRIERHDGLVILATNLRSAIDPAFLRRFQFRVEFPFPAAAERSIIWERLIPPARRAADLDLGRVAELHRLSGGEIRNAALKALLLAEERGGPLSGAILDEAVNLELLEIGRLSRVVAETSLLDSGALLRCFGEALEQVLESRLQRRFSKEIHIVHGAPTREALAGRRPAISVALYRLAVPRAGGSRVGLIVSAWSHRAEEEIELLGVVHEILASAQLSAPEGHRFGLRVQESFDFDLAHRFWSSHGHPVRPSVVVEGEVG